MKIDWKRKLTSRKFWMAFAGLVTGIVILINSRDMSPEAIGGIVMSLGSVVAYIIGEGLADSGHFATDTNVPDKDVGNIKKEETE